MSVLVVTAQGTAVFWNHMSAVLQQTCRLEQLVFRQLAGFYQFFHSMTPRHFQLETQMER